MRNLIITIITLFALQAQAQFCTSSAITGSYLDFIDEVEVGFSSFSSYNDAGYGNFTHHTFSLDQGLPFPIRLTPSDLTKVYDWYIWVDLDQSGSFEQNELVYTEDMAFIDGMPGVIEDYLFLPATARLGNTRMRVQMFHKNGTEPISPNPCHTGSYGEVEDYTLNVYGYCPSAGTPFGIDSYYFIESVGINDMVNATELHMGMNDFTGMTVAAQRGSYLTMDLDAANFEWGVSSGFSWRVLIDFNADMDFDDAGESFIYNNLTNINPNILIPHTAAMGATRMRIQFGRYFSSSPCSTGFHGETEDYTLVITEAGAVCDSYAQNTRYNWISSLTIGDFTFEMDYNYGYQNMGEFPISIIETGSTVNCAFQYAQTNATWSDAIDKSHSLYIDFNDDNVFDEYEEKVIDNAFLTGSFDVPFSLTPGLKNARLILSNSGSDEVCGRIESGDVIDFKIEVESSDEYCTASGTDISFEGINAVGLGAYILDVCPCNGYVFEHFEAFPVQAGEETNLVLWPFYPGTSTYAEYWKVWIDYNQDGDFDDADEEVYATPYAINGNIETTITIPETATLGETRMRVAMQYGSSPNACGTFASGMVSDFMVNIQASYCTASADSSEEWIESVAFSHETTGAMQYTSGNNDGYGDFSNDYTFYLRKGVWMNFTGTPGYAADNYAERWNIFIDFNQDGDFEDAGENPNLYWANHYGIESQIGTINDYIMVPTSALTGATRMRIVMTYYERTTACGYMSYGEVEDYTVFISEGTSGTLQADEPTFVKMAKMPKSYKTPTIESGQRQAVDVATEPITASVEKANLDLNIFPNPSKGISTLQIDLAENTDATIQIFASNGQQIQERSLGNTQFVDTQIDITNQPAGTYLVQFSTSNQTVTKQLLKVE